MSEREYKALRSVPASTWMEGFCVTKQMEEACMCLMSGEVSVTAQSQTVSRAHKVSARQAGQYRNAHRGICRCGRCFTRKIAI